MEINSGLGIVILSEVLRRKRTFKLAARPSPRLSLSRGILAVISRQQHIDRGAELIPRAISAQVADDACCPPAA